MLTRLDPDAHPGGGALAGATRPPRPGKLSIKQHAATEHSLASRCRTYRPGTLRDLDAFPRRPEASLPPWRRPIYTFRAELKITAEVFRDRFAAWPRTAQPAADPGREPEPGR